MKTIRRAVTQDNRQISNLRVTEFQRSNQFTLLKPEKLLWGPCDEANVVLAAWDGNQPVATMRAVVVGDHREAADCVQCTVPHDAGFPAIVFNSAATHHAYRGIGLNQALRYYFLLAAIRNGIETILSPIYKGAPRIAFMETLGYHFVTPSESWQNKLDPRSERILGLLPRGQMHRAFLHIQKTRPGVLWEYQWQGRPIGFKRWAHIEDKVSAGRTVAAAGGR